MPLVTREYLHHIVYRTTCMLDGRTYIGVHSTNDLEDGYLGSGILIDRAVKAYGPENFTREILSHHPSRLEASEEEKRLVHSEYILCPKNFNLRVGGDNGVIPRPLSYLPQQVSQRLVFNTKAGREGKRAASAARWAKEGASQVMSDHATRLWSDSAFKAKMAWSQRQAQGYWHVWKEARRIYDRWIEMDGPNPYPSGMPKRGSGHKALGKWYVSDRFDMVGDESVFRNMVDMFKSGWNPHNDEVYKAMLNSSVAKSMVVVRGSSGTGKGTRVCQFLTYLQEKGHENEVVKFLWEGKEKTFGTFFPGLKLMFVGMFTMSNKSQLTSWTSMDYIHALVSKTEKARGLLAAMWTDPQVTFVVEGEPMMASDKWRPLFLADFHKLQRFLFLTYMYEDRGEYDKRIIGRSGKAAGEAGWSRNEGYLSEFNRTTEELMQLGLEMDLDDTSEFRDPKSGHLSYNRMLAHDAPLSSVGDNIMEFLGLDCLSREDYALDCINRPVLRSIGQADPLAGRVPPKVKATKPQKPEPQQTTASLSGFFGN